MADISGAFEVDGLTRQKEALESLMMSNPAMEKRVRQLIRKVLLVARREISGAARCKMNSDPRQAYKAVKMSVYRQILGGNVSLLNKRRASGTTSYEPPRKLRQGQRGGNRVPRGQRTEEVMHYAGPDRAFILRFLNQGTTSRVAGSRGGRLSGNRGSIAPRAFFDSSSHAAIQKAAGELSSLIDELIRNEIK